MLIRLHRKIILVVKDVVQDPHFTDPTDSNLIREWERKVLKGKRRKRNITFFEIELMRKIVKGLRIPFPIQVEIIDFPIENHPFAKGRENPHSPAFFNSPLAVKFFAETLGHPIFQKGSALIVIEAGDRGVECFAHEIGHAVGKAPEKNKKRLKEMKEVLYGKREIELDSEDIAVLWAANRLRKIGLKRLASRHESNYLSSLLIKEALRRVSALSHNSDHPSLFLFKSYRNYESVVNPHSYSTVSSCTFSIGLQIFLLKLLTSLLHQSSLLHNKFFPNFSNFLKSLCDPLSFLFA
jgi:hypothetical protein